MAVEKAMLGRRCRGNSMACRRSPVAYLRKHEKGRQGWIRCEHVTCSSSQSIQQFEQIQMCSTQAA
jgi:hypothetical protein